MTLTAAELERLTGYKRPSAQLRWLRRKGFKADMNARGDVVLAVAEFSRKMVGGRAAQQEPDWDALNG